MPKSRRHIDVHSLTDAERKCFALSLRNLRAAFGSWKKLGEAAHVNVSTLKRAAMGRGSVGLAWQVAKAAGLTMEAILTTKLTSTGSCTSCGRSLVAQKTP
jgi:hypothetical protein